MSALAVVRRASLDDLPELVALWSHYIREHQSNPAYRRLPPDGLAERRKAFARRLEQEDAAVYVLARDDGGLDGMVICFVERNEPYFLPPRYARFQTPFVRREARRRGHLKRLLEAAFVWAREQELTEIRLHVGADNLMANAIADELGFEAVEVVRRRALGWERPPDRQVAENP